MDARQISVATITWARTADEEALLRHSLPRLASLGLRLAIADAGTNGGFTEFLRTLPGVTVVVPAQRGLIAQVQASLAAALTFDTPSVLYTESDKETFFRDRLSPFLDRARHHPDAGVVLASRSEQSFATFPPMQRYTEGVANHLCAGIIGVHGDYFYGPFVAQRSLMTHVAHVDRALGWGWRPALFAAAHRAGHPVVLLPDEHPCPADQRHEDAAERVHRMRQLSQNVAGLIA